MNKLPEPFKTNWIEALESGKFKQGRSKLYGKVDDSYCCLGVACVVAGIPKEKISGLALINPRKSPETIDFHEVPKLLHTRNSFGGEDNIDVILSQMNDRGTLFAEIAKFIKENL